MTNARPYWARALALPESLGGLEDLSDLPLPPGCAVTAGVGAWMVNGILPVKKAWGG